MPKLIEIYKIIWTIPGNEKNKYYPYLKWSFRTFWISWLIFFIGAFCGTIWFSILIILAGINCGISDNYYNKKV